MGRLGFCFEITNIENKIVLINKTLVEKKYIVVFVEKANLKGDTIIGLQKSLNRDETEFFYLKKDLTLENYIVFETAILKYAKISLNDRTVIDFEYLTFWFSIGKYKLLWDLLRLELNENFEERLIKHILEILELI